MRERLAGASADLSALQADLSEAERAKLAEQAAAAAMRERLAGASADLSALQADLSEAERAKLAEQAAAAALRERLAGASADLSALQADLSEAERAKLAEQAAAAALRERLAGASADLSAEETARLAEVAAAEALREKLRNADTELTAMTLALEEQRKRAEDTLTLLAAADVARKDLDLRLAAAILAEQKTAAELAGESGLLATQEEIRAELAAALAAKLAAENAGQTAMSEAEQRLALLATANMRLSEEQVKSADAERKMALLNQQLTELRGQLGALQATLDDTAARDSNARVQIENLGGQLNSALATVAAEQRRRAELEAAERARLEAEAKNLESYRSEFFGKLRQLLVGREGVQIVGDRFVFSSEVLFQPGSADLAPAGQAQIASVVGTLQEIIGQIPPEIDWMIRVDGHTDNVPLTGSGKYTNNWELSQGRALSVVLHMVEVLGFPQDRVAATGFGEFRPVALGDSPEARAQNRRIELKLTER